MPVLSELEKLAAQGGKPVRTAPLPPWPCFGEDEIAAVDAVLRFGRVNYWTGDEGKKFEQEYAEFTDTPYAVALANGTVALEAALYALGIGGGDEVIVPSRTFIASASCIVRVGARPVVADIDPISQTLTAASVQDVMSARTKAILVVHLAGWPCDLEPLCELARSRGLYVIEDCAQAHGATYKGKPVGGLGDVGAFSFCQDKILTTAGEGGMLVTHNREIWRRVWEFKDHGKSFEKVSSRQPGNHFRWVHDSFGTNWRMTEIQAAVGRVALRKVPSWVDTRQRFARILDKRLSGVRGLRVTAPGREFGHSYYKYYAFVNPEQLGQGWSRDRIIDAIVAEGIPCYSGVCSEIYLENAFPNEWKPRERLPHAKKLGETSLMFLLHPTMKPSDIEDTANAVEKVMAHATSTL